MKNYNQSPLPFQGQKRKFLKEFKTGLEKCSPNAIYVDLFGGSGLLSHTVKQHYPDATVVYNDYDNYTQRIKAIPKTNKILADLRSILKDYPDTARITGAVRDAVLARIKKEKGFVDYITLSSSVMFSMNYAVSYEQMESDSLYNNIRQNDYDATDYLKGVQVVRKDYKQLFAEYSNKPNVVYLVDPPYLSTDTSTYSSNGYWKLQDYLNVLDTLKAGNYFYFTSNKSSVIELCEWVANKTGGVNPFAGAVTRTVSTTMNHTSKYTDIMLYKVVK